jgi:Fe-S-cluster containining protein
MKTEQNKEWKCKRCGHCCKFIIVPVAEDIDIETGAYLEAHGIAIDDKKLIIPAVCRYLDVQNGSPIIYRCKIHGDKFSNCRLGAREECEAAKKAWELLEEMRKEDGKR